MPVGCLVRHGMGIGGTWKETWLYVIQRKMDVHRLWMDVGHDGVCGHIRVGCGAPHQHHLPLGHEF